MLRLDEIMGIDLINSDKYLNEIKEKEENININDKKYIEAQKRLFNLSVKVAKIAEEAEEKK